MRVESRNMTVPDVAFMKYSCIITFAWHPEFIACIQMRYISAPLSKHHIMESLCKTMYINN